METLIWKLTLVPVLIAVVTLVGRRFGQSIAGWLGSFPIVVGPVLWILALEQGGVFLSQAALAALAGILPAMVFFVVYAQLALRLHWVGALMGGLTAWLVSVVILASWQQRLPIGWGVALAIALVGLWAAPRLMPRAAPLVRGSAHRFELPARMIAGVMVTLIASEVGERGGATLSGYASLFPSVGIIVASFNHAQLGAGAAVHFLHGMTYGMWSVASFCLALTLVGAQSVPAAFGLAIALAIATHAVNRWRQRRAVAG